MRRPQDTLLTPRLSLRRFTPDDAGWLREMHADPDVMRWVGGVLEAERSAAVLEQRILRYYDEHPGLGIWATVERASGAPIGMHLVNHIQGETLIQLGFVLRRSAWGTGYGTEMGRALVRYAFETLAVPRLHAIANLENLASQRVLEKCGLRRQGERAFAHPAYAPSGPLAFFFRDREEWLAEHPEPVCAMSAE